MTLSEEVQKVRAARLERAKAAGFYLSIFILLIGVWISAAFITGALHEYGMRNRLAQGECPYSEYPDQRRLSAAREREMWERYCRPRQARWAYRD